MDPFIEASGLWENFHALLIAEIQRVLAAAVPSRYAVRAGERSYVVLGDAGANRSQIQADLAVVAPSGAGAGVSRATEPAAPSVSDSAPVVMLALPPEEHRETFLEIYQLVPERRLVTVIELLSPSNKRPQTRGWRTFQRKRRALLAGAAHYVEIDLLRRGTRPRMANGWPDNPYYILVARQQESPRCLVWPATSIRRLPIVPIPLIAPDPDLTLDLQPLVEEIYQRSRYDADIDYGDTAAAAFLTDAERCLLTKQPPTNHDS
jgi:hypothetical protein